MVNKTKTNIDINILYDLVNFYKNDAKLNVKKLLDSLIENGASQSYFIEKDQYRSHVREVLLKLALNGIGKLPYPKLNGGQDDMGSYMMAFETLCSYNMNYAVKLGVQFGLFGGAILQLGTKSHHDLYLEKTGNAEILGCFAMTETGHGSNVKNIETSAQYLHSEEVFILNSPNFKAGKEYIGNALHGSYSVVFAQLSIDQIEYGVHAFILKYRNEDGTLIDGVKVEDCGEKMGLNGIDNGRIWFDNIRIPRENLLNRFGNVNEEGKYESIIENPNRRFFSMLGALVGGRISIGLGSISAAKVALSIAIKYAHSRRQFKPDDQSEETLLIDYPTHQHRLMPLLVKAIIYQNSLTVLAKQFCENGTEIDIRKIETKAAGLKAMASWYCTKTIQESREACGGKGYLRENHIADLKADADIFTTFEGDNNVLLQLVAKGLLTEFKESFNDDAFTSTMKYLGGKISFVFSEYNFINNRNTSETHLLDDDFISDSLRYREKKMFIALADRMKSYSKKNVSPNEAFLKSQVHMVDAAKAYVERLAYRNMIDRLRSMPNSKEKDLLEDCTRFYGLTNIMENRYFFLESDYMDGSKTKALRRVYSELMEKIKLYSLDIVDSFCLNKELINIKP
jgi:acyl-CoA oxidase